MNKRALSLLLALSMTFGAIAYAEKETEKTEEELLLVEQAEEKAKEKSDAVFIQMTIGEKLMIVEGDIGIPLDVPPTIINDRTMLPLRAIFEALGAFISWDDETKTVFAIKGEDVIVMQIGQDVLYLNGEQVEMGVPSVIVDGRTLVPVRAISEALGNDVSWDDGKKTVTITY